MIEALKYKHQNAVKQKIFETEAQKSIGMKALTLNFLFKRWEAGGLLSIRTSNFDDQRVLRDSFIELFGVSDVSVHLCTILVILSRLVVCLWVDVKMYTRLWTNDG